VRVRVFAISGLLLTAIAIAPWTAVAATNCGDGKGDVAVIGRLLRLDDATATFSVEASSRRERPYLKPPLPARGTNLPVVFSGGDEFLRVRQRYDVQLWWSENHFVSHVPTAEDCGGGTRNADGSVIETSLLSRPEVKRALLVIAIALFVTVGLPAIWFRQRRQQRRRRNDAVLRSAAG
jgi:hypothetical protein